MFGGALTLVAGLQFDNDKWLADNHPRQIAQDMLAEQFGDMEATMLIADARTLFTEQGLAQSNALVDAIKSIKRVEDVLSPYDATYITTDAGGAMLITTYRDAYEDGHFKSIADLRKAFQKSDYFGRLLSEDGRYAAYVVKQDSTKSARDRARIVEEVQAILASPPHNETLFATHKFAGDAFLKYTLDSLTKTELAKISALALAGIALLLYIAFGRFWRVGLVLLTAIVAVVVAMAGMVVLGYPLSLIALALPVMLAVIVVADSLHILRYWDAAVEAATPDTLPRAIIAKSFAAAWLPCLTTSATSAVGFGVFWFSEIVMLQHFGVASFLGVMAGYAIMLATLFLGLVLVTPRALAQRQSKDEASKLRMADRVADRLLQLDWRLVGMARRGIFALAIILTVGSVVALVLEARSESNLLDVFFEREAEIRQNFDLVDARLGGSGAISIVFAQEQEDYYREFAPFTDIRTVETALADVAQVLFVESYTSPISEIHQNIVSDGSLYPANEAQLAQEILFSEWSRSAESRDVLAETVNFTFDSKHLRLSTPNLTSHELDALVGRIDARLKSTNPQSLPVPLYTGHSVYFSQLSGDILDTQFVTISLTFLFIFGLLILQFNARFALAGIVSCALPVLIVMGSVAALGYPFDFATVIIASVTMGLSIDDMIHILHRYQVLVRDTVDSDGGRDRTEALKSALFIPGRPIIQTTILFCFGAGVFLSSELVMLQRFAAFSMLGLGLALLGGIVLLPSLLRLEFFNHKASSVI